MNGWWIVLLIGIGVVSGAALILAVVNGWFFYMLGRLSGEHEHEEGDE